MKVHYPKLYNMAHLLALNVLLLPKDLTIIFIYAIVDVRNSNVLKNMSTLKAIKSYLKGQMIKREGCFKNYT